MKLQKWTAFLLALVLLLGGPWVQAEEESLPAPSVSACGLRGWHESAGYQYVIMGYYPYEADGTEAPVLWQVLDVDADSGKALLLTTYLVDVCQPVYCDDPAVANSKKYRRIDDYGESDMNVWLNETLFPRLLEGEPVIAAVTEEKYGRLYPLTDEELMTEKYGFPNVRYWAHPEKVAFATPYTLSIKLHPKYGSKVYKDPDTGTSSYWAAALKYAGGEFMQICGLDGHLSYGTLVRTTVGLRVALRLDVSQIQVVSGSGTIWDPCRLALVSDGAVATPPIHDERPTPVPTTPKPRSGKNRKKSDPTPAPEAATPVPTPEWIGDYAQESGW